MNVEITPERIQLLVQGLIMFIGCVAVHEFGHAWMADRLGDGLPRRQGRVTLNPLVHADPIGTVLLPAFFILSTGGIGFAWGKPVMHTTLERKRRLLIAFAGPAMNVLLAALVAVVLVVLIKVGSVTVGDRVWLSLLTAVQLNFILFFFNLIPAEPLDGGSVARGLIPHGWVRAFDEYAKYGPFVILAVMLVPKVGRVVLWPANYMTKHLYDNLMTLAGLG
ncbi:MAG: site-2 protease family protein [Kofleriaceae bacterium]